MSDITELKKQLVSYWRDLQDESKSDDFRTTSYRGVVSTTNKIRELDKTFALDEKALEKYIKFRPTDVEKLDKKVKWTDEGSYLNLITKYNSYVSTAVEIVKSRHPELDTDTDKFGTIVNATVANLIALGKN